MSTLTLNYLQERLQTLKGKLEYCKEALGNNLEKWERKEYEMVAAECQKDIEELQAHLANIGAA